MLSVRTNLKRSVLKQQAFMFLVTHVTMGELSGSSDLGLAVLTHLSGVS